MSRPLHGVAFIRVSEGPFNPREVYGVIFYGVLQAKTHVSWAAASQHFRRLERGIADSDFDATAAPIACTCAARFEECVCAIDGVRNPRGAGRGRMAGA